MIGSEVVFVLLGSRIGVGAGGEVGAGSQAWS